MRPRSAAAAALGAVLGLALAWSCGLGPPRAEGEAAILGSWQEAGGIAAIAYRVSCGGGLAVERWGLTVRVDTETRRYWASLVAEERLPAGSSSTGVLRVGFADAGELLVAGSAALEEAWFE